MNRNDLIKQVIPVLWHIKPNMPRLRWRSSYGSKARVERLLGYISNEQFIQAALELGIPHIQGDPNYTFAISPKFPFEWMLMTGRLTQRPFGGLKKEWAAYQETYQWWDEMKSNIQDAEDHQQEVLAAYNDQNPQDPITLSQ